MEQVVVSLAQLKQLRETIVGNNELLMNADNEILAQEAKSILDEVKALIVKAEKSVEEIREVDNDAQRAQEVVANNPQL